MKRTILLLMFCLTMGSAFSQSANFGLRVGGALNSWTGEDGSMRMNESGVSPKWGPTAGFYINSTPSDYFWIKTEFMYVGRGLTTVSGGRTLQETDHYIDIYPITPAFHFYGFQLFAGPAISVFAAQSHQYYDPIEDRIRVDTDTDGRNIFQFGLVAGIEYEAPFGLNVGVRYVRHFSSIFEPTEHLNTRTRVESYNSTLLFTLGFTFGKDD
ncbi:MAG: porin family protein [Cytophagaceae bacterium]